jgi:hypothetical protein
VSISFFEQLFWARGGKSDHERELLWRVGSSSQQFQGVS